MTGPSPRPTRDLDTRDLIEAAIDMPELRQVDADVLLAVAEAVIETVGPELERLRARVAELEASKVYGIRWLDGREHAHEYAGAVALVSNYPGRCVLVQACRGPWTEVSS